MSTEKNLNNLVINKVESQEVYNYMKANSLINEDELYLVEGENEIAITEATETESGLMSASDKVKLNGIEDGANKTIVDSTLSSTSGNPVQNKVINSKFDEIKVSIDRKVPSTRTVNGKALTSNITLTASDVGALPNTTQIPSIDGLATETYVDNKVAGLVVSAPTITVIPNTAEVQHIDSVGKLPSYTAAKYTAPSVKEATSKFASEGLVAAIDEIDKEMLVFTAAAKADALTRTGFNAGSYTAASFDAGSLPTLGAAQTVVTGIASATASQPHL